ncbi:MAG: hypothetical protein GY792_17340 [Gammaproteobacteria bacterium]|nr:hypothetical protein [Gammaproteobacteria bacterium]
MLEVYQRGTFRAETKTWPFCIYAAFNSKSTRDAGVFSLPASDELIRANDKEVETDE